MTRTIPSVASSCGACCALLFVLPSCGAGQSVSGHSPAEASLEEGEPECSLGIGQKHACAACSGQVICWGINRFGQLGRGTSTVREGAAAIEGLDDIVEVSVGARHSCARRADGALFCWGSNAFGQLGDGTRQFRVRPERVEGIADAIDLDVARHRSCAVRRSGEVWCWGRVHDGPPIVWTRPMPVDESGDALEVTLGTEHACSRHRPGTVTCWGEISLHSDDAQRDLDWLSVREVRAPHGAFDDAALIASGGDSSCALSASGRVYCWGRLVEQQADLAHVQPTGDVWTVASVPEAVELEAGLGLVCVRTGSGRVECMGPGPRGVEDVPVERPLAVFDVEDAVAVSLADEVGCIHRRSGALACWGRRSDVFLEEAGQAPPSLGQRVPGLENVRAIATREDVDYAVRRDGTVVCWAPILGATRPQRAPQQLVGLTDVQEVASFSDEYAESCALHRNGTVSCWRKAGGGCDAQESSTATLKSGLVDATALGAGVRHACALRSNGTVVCWGDNAGGRLGVPQITESKSPVEVPGLTGVDELAVGRSITCVRRGGDVSCWGDWTEENRFSDISGLEPGMPPTAIEGIHDAVQLVAGFGYACARTAQGTVLCWGHNDYGSLGGEAGCSAEPTAVPGIDSGTRLWGGTATNCARLRSGEVRCWGYNGTDGFLDPEGDRLVREPVPVAVGADVEDIAPTGSEICVSTALGSVRCWSGPPREDREAADLVPTPVPVLGVNLRSTRDRP